MLLFWGEIFCSDVFYSKDTSTTTMLIVEKKKIIAMPFYTYPISCVGRYDFRVRWKFERWKWRRRSRRRKKKNEFSRKVHKISIDGNIFSFLNLVWSFKGMFYLIFGLYFLSFLWYGFFMWYFMYVFHIKIYI